MIRFLPDTWADALLRPIAMAAPDAGVYVEMMAPDIRFLVIFSLVLILCATYWRRKWSLSPTMALLAFVTAAFAMWLATSGNGRYFIPILLVAGPLCIALISRLRATVMFKATIAVGVIGLQAVVIHQNNPWHVWGFVPWAAEPFFSTTLDHEALTRPATYVGITSNAYSLIAPRFPASSRWVNISSQPDPEKTDEGRRLQLLLKSSKSLMLFIRSTPQNVTFNGQPDAEISQAFNALLAKQYLMLDDSRKCRLLPSRGLAHQLYKNKNINSIDAAMIAKVGFWICPLKYPAELSARRADRGNPAIDQIFEIVERSCPRFFPPGAASTFRIADGFARDYGSADMKLYVLDNGNILYKYWRALNPGLVGTITSIKIEGFKMDCNNIRGRTGLAWNRQL